MPGERSWSRRQVVGLILAASASHAAAQPAARPQIVATFSILADMVRQIVGPAADVTALVGPGGDPHLYEPKPNDARLLGSAAALVENGLGFDAWAGRLAEGVGFKGLRVEAARALAASAHLKGADDHDHGPDGPTHDHGADPHIWQDVAQAQKMVAMIAADLSRLSPAIAAAVGVRAPAYQRQLAALDREIRTILAAVAPARRTLITAHASMNYFGRAYGFRMLAAKGLSTATEPSAAQLARLIRVIRAEKVGAVFLESLKDPRLIARVREETGARLGGALFTDSLSPAGGQAPTYIAMMRHNARTIARALAA